MELFKDILFFFLMAVLVIYVVLTAADLVGLALPHLDFRYWL